MREEGDGVKASIDHSRFSLVLDRELAWEAMWRAREGRVLHPFLPRAYEHGAADLFKVNPYRCTQKSWTARFAGCRFLVVYWPQEPHVAPEVYIEKENQ